MNKNTIPNIISRDLLRIKLYSVRLKFFIVSILGFSVSNSNLV